MKTAQQIADEAMNAFTIASETDLEDGHDARDVEECSADFIHEQIVAAIEADRAQRTSEDVPRQVGATVHGIDATIFAGEDGASVIQIDTHEGADHVRVNLNDAVLFDGGPEEHDESQMRECDNCGDEVQTLSSDDLCNACVLLTRCTVCGSRFGWQEIVTTSAGYMCEACVHDAHRSGATL